MVGEVRIHHIMPELWVMDVRRTAHRWVVFHECYSFCLVERVDPPSLVDWRYNHRTYTVDPDHMIMMMQPGELHANVDATPPGDFVVVQVGEPLMRQVARELGWRSSSLNIPHPYPGIGHPALVRALRRFRGALCQTLFDSGPKGGQCTCFRSIDGHMENLGEVAHAFIENCVEGACESALLEHGPAVLRKAIDYLDAHVHEPYSLPRLAEASGCPKYYLSHLFKQEMQVAPQEYLNRIRVAKTCRLLASRPDWTLERVVNEFNWPGREGSADDTERVPLMIRHFKRALLITPGEFRSSLSDMSRSERLSFARHVFRRAPGKVSVPT